MTWSYPPDTKAFLYYFTSPEKPRIAGELRLRVTSSDDPASFESGSDLLLTNGQPWLRPLFSLPRYYSPLYELVREDRLVPDDLDAVLSTLFPSGFPRYRRRQILYALNDTFIVDFSSAVTYFTVITERGVEWITLFAFYESREMCGSTPYTGAYTNHHLSIL